MLPDHSAALLFPFAVMEDLLFVYYSIAERNVGYEPCLGVCYGVEASKIKVLPVRFLIEI